MFKFETSVLNSEGQPIVGATVSIFAAGTNTLVQLYEDDQTTLKANPLTSDSTGLVQCKAANGKYDYLVANLPGGGTRRINGVIFDDPSEAGTAGIALSMPGEFTVTGSPGASISVIKKNQVANSFYRGPNSGVAAPPTFGAIIAEDLPAATSSAFGATLLSTPATVAARDGTRVVTGAQMHRVLIDSQTVSGASSVIFDNTKITDVWKRYEIEVIDAVPGTDSVIMQLLLSTDNAASFLSSYRMYTNAGTSNGTGTVPGNSAAFGYIPLSGTAAGLLVSNASGRSWNGTIELRNPRGAFAKSVRVEGEWSQESGYGAWVETKGFTNVNTAINAAGIKFSSGNISATVNLYAVV